MTSANGGDGWVAPRSASGLLDAAARLYFSRFGAFFSVAVCATVIQWALALSGPRPAVFVPGAAQFTAVLAGGTAANPLLWLLGSLVLLAAYGALIAMAGPAATGGGGAGRGEAEASPGAAVRQALYRLWPLLVVVVASALAGGAALLLLIVPGVLLLTWWAVGTPIAVLEGRRAMASMGRSRRLVGGLFWHVLGTVFFGAILTGVVSSVLVLVGFPLLRLPGAGGAVLWGLWNAGIDALLLPYFACLLTLLYFDLRARKEGADLMADAGGGVPTGTPPGV